MAKKTTTEYRVEIRESDGSWGKYFSCESGERAIDSAKILNDNYQTKDFRAAKREVTEWEEIR